MVELEQAGGEVSSYTLPDLHLMGLTIRAELGPGEQKLHISKPGGWTTVPGCGSYTQWRSHQHGNYYRQDR